MSSITAMPMYGVDPFGVGPAHQSHWIEGIPEAEKHLIEKLFLESIIGHERRGTRELWNAPKLRVLNVMRVHNPCVSQAYLDTLLSTRRASSRNRNDKLPPNMVPYWWQHITERTFPRGCNEILAWHGTKRTNVGTVEKEGLDMRMAKTSGMYGLGIYLTPHASKSDMYQPATQVPRCVSLQRQTSHRFLRTGTEGPREQVYLSLSHSPRSH